MLQPPPPYCLRPMQLADLKAVTAIDRLAYPTPTRETLFRHELEENKMAHYQVLQMGDSIVGFAGYWLIGDEVHVSTIAVHPHWQGRHLGELLFLNILLDVYQHPACLVTLEVRRSNTIAQALYQKYRLEVVGERRAYYRDTGEDALLMTVTPLDGRYHQFLVTQQATLFARLSTEA
ncbi:MAG: ribosomal protein S18-alanine N-acetyltransferase [Chloroflexi bacterium]|nr:ribosomal protein S18-alanine N-acetyltransferase [Chloroflexota bacterium]